MAENQNSAGSDWTERIPGLGRLPVRTRQLVLLIICAVVIIAMGTAFFLLPGAQAQRQSATPAPTTAQPTGGPTIGGGQLPTGPTADAGTSAPTTAPTATSTSETSVPAATSAPAEDDDHDHPDGPYGPDPTPVYSPTSSREPASADEARGRDLLNRVVPAWAEADFSAVRPDQAEDGDRNAGKRREWIATWREDGDVTRDFVVASTDRFVQLWSGAIQLGATVSDAKITEAELLWNSGSDAMWRVTVQRTVAAPGISASTEEVTWDFLITQQGTYSALQSFADPDPANEDPKTYRPIP